jgi:hypothetical protein
MTKARLFVEETGDSFGRRSLREGLSILTVWAAAVWMYRDAFRSSFIQDDFGWLVLSRFHSMGDWARCFFKFNPAGTYRPLSQETYFWLGQKIFGMWPPGFHLFGLAAHLAAVWLLYRFLRSFFRPPAAMAGSLFYAVHGAHVTSMFWISAFPEPLAMVFLLASVLMFVRFDRTDNRCAYALALLAMLLGVMSKESILPIPLILASYCFLRSRRRLVWTIPFFVVSGFYLWMRVISQVEWAPYRLSLGRQTAESLAAYLSWLAGFSGTVVATSFRWSVPGAYRWVAVVVAVGLLCLVLRSRTKSLALFGLLWIVFALQPVLYFANHSYPYYLAPALAGFSLLLASALDSLRNLPARKKLLPGLLVVLGTLWLSYLTVKPEGDWWVERTSGMQDFIDHLLAIDRRVPDDATAYILGLKQYDFGNLENGGVFKAYHLSTRKIRFLLPEVDPYLPARLHDLKESGAAGQAYCFLISESKGGWADRTEAFRDNPETFLPREPVRLEQLPGVALEVGPATIWRGRDTLALRLVNLDVPAIDILYEIDGQLMPPVLQWQLNERHAASVFADMTTPEGEYRFLAIRPSNTAGGRWLKVEGRVIVRRP